LTPEEAWKHPWLNSSASIPVEFQRCSSQDAATPTHKSSAATASGLSSTRSESDLSSSTAAAAAVAAAAAAPTLGVGDTYSMYRVYRGGKKTSTGAAVYKERLSSADTTCERRRGSTRSGSGVHRESSLPEKSSLSTDTFLPPIL
jgi:hypothetical protein